jgi:SNF2 family DNA or RNA helicase
VFNRYPGNCYRCNTRTLAGEGEVYEKPLRLICAACSLEEGYVDNGLRHRLKNLPKGLKLRPFQEADAKLIGIKRACLIGHQMGAGKTIIASVASLRTDTGNLVFTPASVKRNWGREIRRWRPELKVEFADTQTEWKRAAPGAMKSPGTVLIGSYGVLPGTPCTGCRDLWKRLRKLNKKDAAGRTRYDGPVPAFCEHRTEYERHPDRFPICVDGRVDNDYPFHACKKCEGDPQRRAECKTCEGTGRGCKGGVNSAGELVSGCHQTNPVPLIPPGVLLLADEVHAFKNPRTTRTKSWRELRKAIWKASGYVYGLSGTPCEGKPPEFWEVLTSLGLERAAFGNYNTYYDIFREWFTNKKGSRKPPTGEKQQDLHRRLKRVQVMRLRKDVLTELPPVIEKIIEVEMDEKTVKAVNEAVHHMLAVREAWGDVTKPKVPSQRLPNPYEKGLWEDEKVRRKSLYDARVEHYFQERPWNTDEEIAKAVHEAMVSRDNLPSIEELSRIRSMLSQAKVAAVKEWMQNCEDQLEPTIVFSEHVQILKKLMERPGWECFHGGLTAKARDTMVQQFQNATIEHGLGVSIRAGGEGITLVRARVCGFIDVSWNPAKNAQALARLLRIGAEQHDSIVAVYFRANHVVDRLVQETNREKLMIMDAMEWDTSMPGAA